jgi:hypothetical protein
MNKSNLYRGLAFLAVLAGATPVWSDPPENPREGNPSSRPTNPNGRRPYVRQTEEDLAALAAANAAARANLVRRAPVDTFLCPVEVGPGQIVFSPRGGTGGGMAGNGWDGAGLNAATIFWRQENVSPDLPAEDIRSAYITAMGAWAGVVRITFQEMPVANLNQSVDWAYTTGDHCALEAAECGDPDCAFDGPSGVLAHAGFPPGVNSTCINPQAETWAGNVHFDDAETWELDDAMGAGPFSLTAIACHEVGHSIGMTHSTAPDIMRPSFSSTFAFPGLSANDIANVRAGYAAGVGSVITLESTGVWVDLSAGATQFGTQAFPFDLVSEGVAGVPEGNSGVTLHIEAGSYNYAGVITKRMSVRREGLGTAYIH